MYVECFFVPILIILSLVQVPYLVFIPEGLKLVPINLTNVIAFWNHDSSNTLVCNFTFVFFLFECTQVASVMNNFCNFYRFLFSFLEPFDFVQVRLSVGFPLLALLIWAEPYHRGFFENDLSIKLPFKPQSISEGLLAGVGFALIIGTVSFTL